MSFRSMRMLVSLLVFIVMMTGFAELSHASVPIDHNTTLKESHGPAKELAEILTISSKIEPEKRLDTLERIYNQHLTEAMTLDAWLFTWNFSIVISEGFCNMTMMGHHAAHWKRGPNDSVLFLDLQFALFDTRPANPVAIITPDINMIELAEIVKNKDRKKARTYKVKMHLDRKQSEPVEVK